ncbi:hypothetical protein [Campylobacter sp. US33a]|uniref:Hydrogenase-4 component G n=1 Tax=Campylobacter sp. CCS1377 TaxID=3158229 RepID=A0AAU7E8F8_9BACT|nr:hypothetical protein [Campylobacter sp. US33a]MCW1360378.1 hypothetical protein [Campylobacter jejuni]TEY02696.1 hypothetical protein ELQ16_04775 [Campylobacter sp. US33a]
MQINTYANSATQTQVSNKDLNSKKESTSSINTQSAKYSSNIDKKTLEELNSLGGKGISTLYLMEFNQQVLNASFGNLKAQSGSSGIFDANLMQKASTILQGIDFSSIGYNGKDILTMNPDELNALVSEEGFFGVENTANRIADFVIQGAGDNLEKLQKGFEGMKMGFEQAEKLWGGELPKISQDTITKAIEKVSARIDELGGKTLDVKV